MQPDPQPVTLLRAGHGRYATLLRVLVLGGALLALAACSDLDVGDPAPLSFTLTAETESGVVGEDMVFQFTAEGDRLDGIVVEYGDGAVDSVAVFGSRTASGTLTHAYAEAGTFAVAGRVEESGQRASDEVTVVVRPPGP